VAMETKTDVMHRRNPMLTRRALLTHIHGDSATFPFFAGRTSTPEMALPEERGYSPNASPMWCTA